METNVRITIKCETKKVLFGYWDVEKGDWMELESGDDLSGASAYLDCSEKLLEALVQIIDLLTDRVSEDLCSIWERLDNAGI